MSDAGGRRRDYASFSQNMAFLPQALSVCSVLSAHCTTPFCPHFLLLCISWQSTIVKAHCKVFSIMPFLTFQSLGSPAPWISLALSIPLSISSLTLVISELILPQCSLLYVRADNHAVAYGEQEFTETHFGCCPALRDSPFLEKCHCPTPTATAIIMFH